MIGRRSHDRVFPIPPSGPPPPIRSIEAPLIPGFFLSKPHSLTPQSGVLSRSIVVGIPSPSRFPPKEPEKPRVPPVLWGFFMCGPLSGPDQSSPVDVARAAEVKQTSCPPLAISVCRDAGLLTTP
jgi:hypothetical protein